MAKSKYKEWLTEDGLLLIEAWARNGLTDEQIAHNMGINVATLYRYKQSYCEICNALKKGKEVVDIQVENALFKRAVGYSFAETTKESRPNLETGKYELIVTKEVIKEIPPDTTAQIFWLKNRNPGAWRDKREVGVNGAIDCNNLMAGLTEQELRKLASSNED